MDDPVGVARVIADSEIWVPVHLAIVLGIVLMLGGLVAVYHSIRGGLAGALARFGLFAAVAGVTIGLVLVILDGVAALVGAGVEVEDQAVLLGERRSWGKLQLRKVHGVFVPDIHQEVIGRSR